jgi:hypothetical protein
MKNNIRVTDRRPRMAVGVVLAAVGLATLGGRPGLGTAVGAVAALLGVVLVTTGVARICPAYGVLGVDTS